VQQTIAPFETFTMANFNATLDVVLSRVPTFGWPIAPVGLPISLVWETHFRTPNTLNIHQYSIFVDIERKGNVFTLHNKGKKHSN